MSRLIVPGTSMIWPPSYTYLVMGGSANTATMDADGEGFAAMFHIRKAGTIEAFEFQTGLVAQAPGNGLRVNIEGADTDHEPDGVEAAYRVITTGFDNYAWMESGILSDDGTDTGNKKTVAVGDHIACTVKFESFTAGDDVDRGDIGWAGVLYDTAGAQFQDVGSGWGGISGSRRWSCALKYDDGTYAYQPFTPLHDGFTTTTLINSASSPNETGMVLHLPMGIRTTGATMYCRPLSTYDMHLYDSADILLASGTANVDLNSGAGVYLVYWNTPVVIPPGMYRITIEATGGSNISTYRATVASPGGMEAITGRSDNAYRTQRSAGGAWTDFTGEIVYGWLVYDALEHVQNKNKWNW